MKFTELEEGRTVPGDCGRPESSRPEWLDMNVYQRALEVYKDNVYSVMLAHSCGPVLLGQVLTLALPVKFTGKSATVPLACRRLANTVHHVLAWYGGNIWDKEDYAYESVQQIRRLHGHVAQMMKVAGETPPEGNVWLSQYDMALTQFAFLGPVILTPEKIGMQCSESDLESLLHFWRGVGYLLGMEDRFNICAGNYHETKELFQEIVENVVFPALSNPHEDCEKLVYNGVQALKTHSPFIEYTSFINFSYDLVDFPRKKTLTWYGWACQWIRYIYILMLPIVWIRQRVNILGISMLQGCSDNLRNPQSIKKESKQPDNKFWSYLQKLLLDANHYFDGN